MTLMMSAKLAPASREEHVVGRVARLLERNQQVLDPRRLGRRTLSPGP